MGTMLRRILTLSLAMLLTGGPLHLAMGQEEEPLPMLHAEIVSVVGAARTYQSTDMRGKVVEFTVPSTSANDIRFSRSMDNSKLVDVTVQSIDRLTNLVTVVSDLQQTVVLRMVAADIAALKVNDRFTLAVPYTPVP
jgi:hypothetical protein